MPPPTPNKPAIKPEIEAATARTAINVKSSDRLNKSNIFLMKCKYSIYTTTTSIFPSLSILPSNLSPLFTGPTPAGVPVITISPAAIS